MPTLESSMVIAIDESALSNPHDLLTAVCQALAKLDPETPVSDISRLELHHVNDDHRQLPVLWLITQTDVPEEISS